MIGFYVVMAICFVGVAEYTRQDAIKEGVSKRGAFIGGLFFGSLSIFINVLLYNLLTG